MYIKELQVDGYAALRELKVELEAPITVIYGPNEAGKSTLLRFVRSMLYGFPTRKDLVERGEPVFGGRHGGRLLLAEKSGREWLLERYAERGNELTLRDESGLERRFAQAEWERMLLGGISERLFRQLFSVSLNELHELRSLQGEEIGNYLYHAGLAGGSALTAARRRIGTDMDKLYRPKGTTQEMNRLLAEIKAMETAIRQSRDGVQHYRETEEQLSAIESGLSLLEASLPESRLQVAKLQGAYELREWWLRREALLLEDEELRSRLSDPGTPLLSEERARLWPELKRQRLETAARLQEARIAATDIRSQRERIRWDDSLAEAAPEWERLDGMREAIVAKQEERSELEAERRTLDETVQSVLSRLSPEWGETELLSFGGLSAEREQVRRLQHAWEEEDRATSALHDELQRLTRQEEVLHAELRLASDSAKRTGEFADSVGKELQFGHFAPRSKSALLQAWHQIEDARREYERARAGLKSENRVDSHPSRAANSRSNAFSGSSRRTGRTKLTLGALALLFGLIGLTIPFLFAENGSVSTPTYLLSALLLLLAAGAAIFAARRSSGSASDSSDAGRSGNGAAEEAIAIVKLRRKLVNDRLRQLLQHPETAAALLIPERSGADFREGQPSSEDEDAVWQQLRELVHEQLERLEVSDRDSSKREQLQERMQELRTERELVERDALDRRNRRDELSERWQRWLGDRKLPLHLLPDSLPELLGMAEQGQTMLRQRLRIVERTQALNKTIHEFESAVRALMAGVDGVAGTRSITEAAHGLHSVQAVQWLYRESQKQVSLKVEAERIDRLLDDAIYAEKQAEGACEQVEASFFALLEETKATTEAELEHTIRIDERCRELRKEAREIQLRLESGRDAEAQARLQELLRAHDDASLSALLDERKRNLAEGEDRRSELLDLRGRLAQELALQRRDSEREDSRQRVLELQSKLEQLAGRYAVLSIADRLIVRTKAIFEEEKQPEVLLRASRYFSQMTNRAYVRIVAPGDTKALLAETEDRKLLDSSFLSRGTQEQLYLSMRFALCDAASPEHPLPLLLDDLFVHFDERRLSRTLPVLEELSRTRQIILFTCHRHVAELIGTGLPEARRVTLEG
ncbi:hypothetical protein D7Z26_13275 [Cohnella endophytica]|uniref:YhaN AAA domain-containing protein n=1 Tax=Cohnella endophytica TaxID=2419778 RepID=A0A494Y1L6_9BACL|nr:AAA family ATPase [Cohnella endophytica]RKP54327.1 hypothetical protein D7Z26_13275 [Cohnella endophytica]